VPELQARLGDIRALVEPFVTGRKPARVTVLLTLAGLDIDIRDTPAPAPRAIAKLGDEAARRGLARLTVGGEAVLTLAEPTLLMGKARVMPPAGGFVQASPAAEALLAANVTRHLAGARRVADLFSGTGTFALPLAEQAGVRALEADRAALDALARAARATRGLKPVETEARDLFAHPLSPQELAGFDAVVIDPPHAGAKAQAEALAASTVPKVAAVSCNPATFARDARILVDGGYRLERVVPVDQFVYSAETEVVGLFSRG
jgi:23S rRNA (uracil1939-C5)-methyltransferase